MELVGKPIKHITFGKGIITDRTNDILSINFSGKLKRFVFPDAFLNFISIADQEAQAYIDEIVANINRQKDKDQLRQTHLQKVRFLKIIPNSQTAFGLIENSRSTILDSWSVFSGNHLSGYSKGTPRIPNKLRLNSACLLTECPDGTPEEERQIIGAFMVADDFEGKACKNGVIPSHATHRILLDETDGKLLYWNYFSSTTKSKRWGKMEMKSFSSLEMKHILNDMQKAITNPLRQKIAKDLYGYFCEANESDMIS